MRVVSRDDCVETGALLPRRPASRPADRLWFLPCIQEARRYAARIGGARVRVVPRHSRMEACDFRPPALLPLRRRSPIDMCDLSPGRWRLQVLHLLRLPRAHPGEDAGRTPSAAGAEPGPVCPVPSVGGRGGRRGRRTRERRRAPASARRRRGTSVKSGMHLEFRNPPGVVLLRIAGRVSSAKAVPLLEALRRYPPSLPLLADCRHMTEPSAQDVEEIAQEPDAAALVQLASPRCRRGDARLTFGGPGLAGPSLPWPSGAGTSRLPFVGRGDSCTRHLPGSAARLGITGLTRGADRIHVEDCGTPGAHIDMRTVSGGRVERPPRSSDRRTRPGNSGLISRSPSRQSSTLRHVLSTRPKTRLVSY